MSKLTRSAREKAMYFLEATAKDLSYMVKKKESAVLNPDVEDTITLKLEAHSYLSLKKPELKSKFAKEILYLWQSWSQAKKSDKPHTDELFWPYEGLHEFDTAMLRAWEILGIPGFQKEFESKIESMQGWLMDPPIRSTGLDRYWLIFRSTSFQNANLQYIQKIAFIIKEQLKSPGLPSHKRGSFMGLYYALETRISCIIFLAISRIGGEYLSTAKRFVDLIITYQKENGSILDDVFLTCSFVIALYLTNSDPQRIIQERALDWLIKQQNAEGIWEDKNVPDEWKDDSKVLLTVVVLETIDVITDNKPLPPWTQVHQPLMPLLTTTPSEVQEMPLFSIPKGASWKDILIRLISDEEAEISISGKSRGVKNFITLGFEDKRKKAPDELWRETLITLAKAKGDLSRTEGILDEKGEGRLRKRISRLRSRLQSIFGINEDPFFPIWEFKSYKTKFTISYRKGFEYNQDGDSEIAEVYNNDIKRMEIRERRKIMLKRLEEIKGKKDTDSD